MKRLEQSVSSQIRYLKILLGAANTAHSDALAKHPVIASACLGPWERTQWLDHAAKDLQGQDVPVRITKENERRNWVEVLDGNEWIKFTPLFATLRSDDTYEIHAKGKEKYIIESLQRSLFDIDPRPLMADQELFGYVLRTLREAGEGAKPELHFIYGTKPDRTDYMHDCIRWSDRFIVRFDDENPILDDIYSSPFDPEAF